MGDRVGRENLTGCQRWRKETVAARLTAHGLGAAMAPDLKEGPWLVSSFGSSIFRH